MVLPCRGKRGVAGKEGHHAGQGSRMCRELVMRFAKATWSLTVLCARNLDAAKGEVVPVLQQRLHLDRSNVRLGFRAAWAKSKIRFRVFSGSTLAPNLATGRTSTRSCSSCCASHGWGVARVWQRPCIHPAIQRLEVEHDTHIIIYARTRLTSRRWRDCGNVTVWWFLLMTALHLFRCSGTEPMIRSSRPGGSKQTFSAKAWLESLDLFFKNQQGQTRSCVYQSRGTSFLEDQQNLPSQLNFASRNLAFHLPQDARSSASPFVSRPFSAVIDLSASSMAGSRKLPEWGVLLQRRWFRLWWTHF